MNSPDKAILGAAVRAWGMGDDEADLALEQVLVEQGLLRGDEGAYFEPGAREHGVVHVFLEDGRILEVTQDGDWSWY